MNDKVGSIVLNDDKQVKIFDSELKVFVCHISLAFCEKEEIVMFSLLVYKLVLQYVSSLCLMKCLFEQSLGKSTITETVEL